MNALLSLLLVLTAGSAPAAAAPAAAAAATSSTAEPAPSPHGAADGCLACHSGADRADPGPVVDVNQTCQECHGTRHGHPVDSRVDTAPEGISVPSDWPLDGEKLDCTTCHLEPAHPPEAGGPPADATLPVPWLRGGPYAAEQAFCQQCHPTQGLYRQDPHHLGDPDAGTCAACHVGHPTQGAAPAAASLRVEPADACLPCHADTTHLGIPTHVGVALSDAQAATLPASMPLGAGNSVQCWTCHDVHPDPDRGAHGGAELTGLAAALQERARRIDWAEVVPASARWPGSSDPAHPPLLALPVTDDALCGACHGEGP